MVISQCIMCEYFKGDIIYPNKCEKYEEIPKELRYSEKICKDFKKEE